MGTGKSSAGKLVARQLDMAFVEMDAKIEAVAGKPIPAIFKEDGESRFRELESACIVNHARNAGTVFSLGGGAVLNPVNMESMREHAVVIRLDARPDVILARVSAEGVQKRPLLAAGDPMHEITRLLAARAPFYTAATPLVIDTSDLDTGAVAARVVALFEANRDLP